MMKPNYCSGGTFASGRISSINTPTTTNTRSFCRRDGNGNSDKLGVSQQQLISRGSSSKNRVSSGSSSSCSSSSGFNYSLSATSPTFIVYRSAKYNSPYARVLQTLRSYAKFYVVLPAALFANRSKDVIYQLFGLFLFLILSPLWILMIIGLFIVRRLRYLLVKRLYPNLVQLDEFNSQILPTSTPTESHGMVNSIIWIKGKIDANAIRQRFKVMFTENPHIHNLLRLKQISKFGARLWEQSTNFQLENHIVDASKTFRNFPLVDEPLKELYRAGPNNKSILQKYVSYVVSLPVDCNNPPWKIQVISYISRDDGVREKTCLVIKMHVALIKNGEVQGALRELFLNSPGGAVSTEETAPERIKGSPETSQEKSNIPRTNPILNSYSLQWWMNGEDVWKRLKEIGLSHQKNIQIWFNLRAKQLEFHSKPVVISIILLEARDALKRFLNKLKIILYDALNAVLCYILRVVTVLQAIAAMPMIILLSLLSKRQFKALGLQKHSIPGKKLISWSDLIHEDLMEEICKKIGKISSENVMLMVCLQALRDYYQQNNMPIPRKLGFMVGNAGSALQQSKFLKAIRIPTPKTSYGGTLQVNELASLENRLEIFPEWKILGSAYISHFSHYFLPSKLAYRLQQSILKTHPFLFTHVNLKSDSVLGQDFLPVRQLYGEFVEDFTFWSLPPSSDLGISITLVRCAGKTRLHVLSPFQSMDTVLTHRCNQYLIKLAEDVGVEKSRIPYSRRSSPSSSNCSTPQILSCMNPVDNLGFRSSFKRSESLSNANY